MCPISGLMFTRGQISRVGGGPRFCRERISEIRSLDCVCAKTAGCAVIAANTAWDVGSVNELLCTRTKAAGQYGHFSDGNLKAWPLLNNCLRSAMLIAQ